MNRLERLICVQLYLYGFPAFMAAIPYVLMLKTDNDSATFISIVTYVITFILTIMTSGDHTEKYVDGR